MTNEPPMFVIPGEPIPKERPRRGQHGNFYTPRKTLSFEDDVALMAKLQRVSFEGEVCLIVAFYTGNKLADADNLLKSIMDGLQKGALVKSDRQVREVHVFVYDDAEHPRTNVWVYPRSQKSTE